MEHGYNLVRSKLGFAQTGDCDIHQSETVSAVLELVAWCRARCERGTQRQSLHKCQGGRTLDLLFGATGGLALGAPSRALALLGRGLALGAPSRALFLLDRQAFERELQRGIRRDAPSREALRTVTLFPRDGELTLLANGHAEAALVPAGDNLPDAILARECLLATIDD